jgi:hypothetical protein
LKYLLLYLRANVTNIWNVPRSDFVRTLVEYFIAKT